MMVNRAACLHPRLSSDRITARCGESFQLVIVVCRERVLGRRPTRPRRRRCPLSRHVSSSRPRSYHSPLGGYGRCEMSG
eukprot:6622483-Prymnesium_polylepis.1